MCYIDADEREIYEDLWNQRISRSDISLYERRDAFDVYNSMMFIKSYYNEFINTSDRSIKHI